ncbi:ABC transporter permease [Planctomicrobium sp. SH668]|uniref:ABC transporter permease n=1 Tax=Planctomicrobium sp. SH668 TaxID=3448126 RepID=UPI003F5BEE8C
MTNSAANTTPHTSNAWLWSSYTLIVREVVRFLRQRSRVMSSIVQPIIFWVLFGAGLAGSFQLNSGDATSGVSFQEYFLPGIAVMIVLFTSIFSSISVIQDRNEGFMQGVLVAPVPRSSIVLGKVLGGTVLSMFQALAFIAIAPLMYFVGLAPPITLDVSLLNVLGAVLFLALISLGLCALGYLFAWKIDSIQGYHGVMSVVLLPMWLLSGAFFPGNQSVWLSWVMALNPLTYGVAGLRRVLSSDPASVSMLPPFWVCLTVTAVFAIGCLAIDIWVTRRDRAVN